MHFNEKTTCPREQVPKTFAQAAATFCSHPSTILILAGLGALLWARAQQPVHPLTDAAVASAVAGGWCLQVRGGAGMAVLAAQSATVEGLSAASRAAALALALLLNASHLSGPPLVQEWAVHALLLHSKFDWVGRRIHVGHHQRPYFHVRQAAALASCL